MPNTQNSALEPKGWVKYVLTALTGLATFMLFQLFSQGQATQKAVEAISIDNAAIIARLGNLEVRVNKHEQWIDERTIRIEEFFEEYELVKRK